MKDTLALLRAIGGVSGITIIIWAFGRFRIHAIRRTDFLMMSFFGVSLLVVSIVPDSINILASMLSMENKQFGRLITLLIFSNLLLWVLVFNQRLKDKNNSMQLDLLMRRLPYERFLTENNLNDIKEITVIIPALDEEKNLNLLLPKIPDRINEKYVGVLVVDDGSRDNTIEVVKKHGYPVISNFVNRGGGASLRLGYDIALAGGAKIIVTMDGDGQHLPEEIELLVEPILLDDKDFVIGSRILGHSEKDNMVRWLGIHIFNFIINLLAGTRITDCSNGFRAFRVESLKQVLLLQDQFHTAELIIDAAKKSIRIGEAPITVVRRYSGKSKKGKNWIYGLNFFKTVLKTWLRK